MWLGAQIRESSAAAGVFPNLETQIPPAAIFPGYTVIKGVGWTKIGWDSLSRPLFTFGWLWWAWFGTLSM